MPTEVYNNAMQKLADGGVLLLDGGVSTELQRRGVPMEDEVWSGRVALDHWDAIVDMHCAYIDAGADVITANTYASSRLMLEPAGLSDKVEEINRRSVEAALTARERSGAKDVLVAGSLSHAIPVQIRSEAKPVIDNLGDEVLGAAFREMTALLEAGGADFLLLEMMSMPNRMAQVFQAVASSELPAWCGLSVKRGEDGALVAIHDASVDFAQNIRKAAAESFDVWGIMHTQADLTDAALQALKSEQPWPLMAYPDSGYMQMPNWQFIDTIDPDRFAEFAERWVNTGAQIIGGCCGLGPEHISAIAHLKR